MASDTFDHIPTDSDGFGKNDVFGAPVLCGETVYTDALCRIRKIWTWSVDSLYQDRGRGSLKARLGGNRFGLGGLYTFVSIAGNRLTDQVFDYIGSFSEGLALVMTQESGCGYIDKNMDLVIPLQFDSAEDFYQGYACASIGKEQFYIDKSGQKLPNASPQAWQSYQKLGGFYEGMGLVSTLKLGLGSLAYHSDYADISGTWGFIDGTGREVIPPQYIYALDFCDGIAIVAKGKWTIDPKWDNEHNKGRYWTEEEWWGGIDKAGNEVIPFIFDEIKRFDDCSDAYIAHTGGWKDGHWGVIDRSGNWLASPVFTMIDYSFHEGLFAFSTEEPDPFYDEAPMGIYDCKQQKALFEPQFLNVEFLPDGDFCVSVFDEKQGRNLEKIIDRSGKERFPSVYSSISVWQGEPYEVDTWDANGRKCGLIDRQGHVLVPCIFGYSPRQAWLANPHMPMTFTENGQQGLMDLDGNVILPARYYKLENLDAPFFTASVGNEQGFLVGMISADGRFVIPAEYHYINWCQDGRHFYCCRPGLCEMYEYEPLG